MPWYGFRVFEVGLREGNGRKARDVAKCGDEHLAAYVERLLRERLLERTVTDKADSGGEEGSVPTDRHRGQQALQVSSVERTEHMVRATMFFGRYSDFLRGLRVPGSAEPDADLADIAPARSYRVILNLPPTGERGVLVVEDISRSCPVQMFVRSLKQASQQHAADRAAAPHPDDPEAATRAVVSGTWWRLAAYPMADEEHLAQLIRDGKLERVELIRKGYGRDNTPSKTKLELRVNRLGGSTLARIPEIVSEWARANMRGGDSDETARTDGKHKTITDAEGARALAALIGEDIDADLEAMDFDDGYVVLSENGKGKSLSPSRLSDYFIYPLAQDRQPSDLAFYDSARDTVQRVAKATKLTGLSWPSIL